jgi:hypothetical protein
VLPGAAGDRDEHTYPGCSLAQFTQSGAACLASAVGAEQEDRTVAAWTERLPPSTSAMSPISAAFRLPPIQAASRLTGGT